MNLNDITTKPYILALIIRDDGERLLLGDGTYDFKDTLQHFQADTFANDVVELQGADGQLLAGQVRRAGTQKFAGYIGDASMSKQKIEELRRAFLMFFRKKHFYKVVYIFCDGSAIQRKRGYIVNPPTAPEMWQKFPEYSISLNFEDVNYYEYEEDEFGDEIYAHIVQIALAKALEGGLVWDAIGAVTTSITWSNILSASGEYISINNALDRMAPLASVQIDGNATQDGTPTPDDPVDIQVVTGENVVKISGKNLLNPSEILQGTWINPSIPNTCVFFLPISTGQTITVSNQDTATWRFSMGLCETPRAGTNTQDTGWQTGASKTLTAQSGGFLYVQLRMNSVANITPSDIPTGVFMIERGSTATDYEPFQAQSYEVNLGKNLLNSFTISASGITVATDGTLTVSGNSSANGYKHTGKTLAELAPSLKVGDVVYLYLESDWSGTKAVYTSHGGYWTTGNSKTITSDMLSDGVIVYGGYQTTTTIRIMLTKALDTTYAPYFTPIELAKIGDYQDYIWRDGNDWKVHKEVGKVIYDGSETWSLYTGKSHTFMTSLGSGIRAMNGLCDHFRTGYAASFDVSPCFYPFNTTNMIFSYPDMADVAAFKTWLASNPTTVYYALSTPTDTIITEQTLIDQLNTLGNAKLFVGQNNISTNTLNAIPTLEIEYYGAYTDEGAGYEWEPGGGNQNIITVDGIDNARPVWQVVGPANNPTLTNITTGQTISWQGFVPIGQTLTIDMNEMTADLAGANVFEYITGTWLELRPGNNTLVYTADGGAEADSTLSWNGVAS